MQVVAFERPHTTTRVCGILSSLCHLELHYDFSLGECATIHIFKNKEGIPRLTKYEHLFGLTHKNVIKYIVNNRTAQLTRKRTFSIL